MEQKEYINVKNVLLNDILSKRISDKKISAISGKSNINSILKRLKREEVLKKLLDE